MEFCTTTFRGKNNYNLYQGIAYSVDWEQDIEDANFISAITKGKVKGIEIGETRITDPGSCSLGTTETKYMGEAFKVDGKPIAVSALPSTIPDS